MRQTRLLQLFIGEDQTKLQAGDTVVWDHANECFLFRRGDITTLSINGEDDQHEMLGLRDPIDAVELLLLGLGSNLIATQERAGSYDIFFLAEAPASA